MFSEYDVNLHYSSSSVFNMCQCKDKQITNEKKLPLQMYLSSLNCSLRSQLCAVGVWTSLYLLSASRKRIFGPNISVCVGVCVCVCDTLRVQTQLHRGERGREREKKNTLVIFLDFDKRPAKVKWYLMYICEVPLSLSFSLLQPRTVFNLISFQMWRRAERRWLCGAYPVWRD